MNAPMTLMDVIVICVWVAVAGFGAGWIKGVRDERARIVRSVMSDVQDETDD